MWIAKNSITGTTYGDKFDSIYECQDFIDKNLIIIEYLSQRLKIIEHDFLSEEKFDRYMKSKYPNGYSILEMINERINYALQPILEDMKKSLDSDILRVATDKYTSNHVIRCWNTSQKRFATGFDF